MICLIDIHAANTRFYDATTLIAINDLPSEGKFRSENHTTEYLIHGRVEVKDCSSTVSLAKLRQSGLFELLPELDDEDCKAYLNSRVKALR